MGEKPESVMVSGLVRAGGRCTGAADGWTGYISYGFAAVDAPQGGAWYATTAVPGELLAGQVLRYSGYQDRLRRTMRLQSMPWSRVVLFVCFDTPPQFAGRAGQASLAAGVFGLRADATVMQGRRHGGRTMMVELSPHGAYTLLGVPMHELTGGLADLTDLFGDDARRLAEQLAETVGWQRRFALLEDLLTARAATGPAPAPQVRWAWRQLHRSGGRVRVEQLASEIGWSRQHLLTRFREQIGLAPKAAARVIRFQRALRLLQRPDHPGLTELAGVCGYSDQAHFTREFRALTGVTPTDLTTRPGWATRTVRVTYRHSAGVPPAAIRS